MKEILKNIPNGAEKKIYISKNRDPYMQMFLKDYCLRPSCYECVAKKVKMSDLTIADFWRIKDVAPEMIDGKGISLVLIRTDKGQKIFNSISSEMNLKEVSYEAGVKGNSAEYKSCTRPSQRNVFFDDMCKMSFDTLQKKYNILIKYSLPKRIVKHVKIVIKRILQSIRQEKTNGMGYGLLFVYDCKNYTKSSNTMGRREKEDEFEKGNGC